MLTLQFRTTEEILCWQSYSCRMVKKRNVKPSAWILLLHREQLDICWSKHASCLWAGIKCQVWANVVCWRIPPPSTVFKSLSLVTVLYPAVSAEVALRGTASPSLSVDRWRFCKENTTKLVEQQINSERLAWTNNTGTISKSLWEKQAHSWFPEMYSHHATEPTGVRSRPDRKVLPAEMSSASSAMFCTGVLMWDDSLDHDHPVLQIGPSSRLSGSCCAVPPSQGPLTVSGEGSGFKTATSYRSAAESQSHLSNSDFGGLDQFQQLWISLTTESLKWNILLQAPGTQLAW